MVAEPSAPLELYPLVACMAVCLPRLEELSLDKQGRFKYHDQTACPSILAPLAGLPRLARLSVSYPGYPGDTDIEVFQAGPGGRLAAFMHGGPEIPLQQARTIGRAKRTPARLCMRMCAGKLAFHGC